MARTRSAPARSARTRPVRTRPAPARCSGRTAGAAGTFAAAAAAGLALLAGCGTASAGSADTAAGSQAPSATAVGSPAVTTGSAGTTGSAATTGSAVTTGSAGIGTPPAGGGSTPAAAIVGRVRVPLVLPAGSIPVAGSVTGVVTLGLDRCLFLRTDAGQEFALGGLLGAQARARLIGRQHPMLPAPDGSPAALTTPDASGLRIRAWGSVSDGASVCSTPFRFTADSGAIQDVAPGQ